MRPLLVGEDNPLSADPRRALSPLPAHHASGRLAWNDPAAAGRARDAVERACGPLLAGVEVRA